MIRAKYTIVLKTLLDDENVKPLIDKALSTYPMYQSENKQTYTLIPTREELNNKLLNHYKYREIGFETIGRFIDELEISMNEIMPYYYQLLKTNDIINGIDDLFGNVDIEEKYIETVSGESNTQSNVKDESTTTSSTNGFNKNVKSTTPQGDILGISSKNIDSVDHADEVNWNNSSSEDRASNNGESESNVKNESSGTTEHTLTKKGNQGVNTYAHDMEEFRTLIRNIEQEIINHPRITELFMNVY